MKRFYCTICKRVKRVRKMPTRIQDADSIDVTLRVGECNRHNAPKARVVRPAFVKPQVQKTTPQVNRKQARNAR